LEERDVPSIGFVVNTTLDTPDDNIGDGFAQDSKGLTLLRSAIQEGNKQASLGQQQIQIQFALDKASKIELTSSLETLSGNFAITGINFGDADSRITISRKNQEASVFLRLFDIGMSSNIYFSDLRFANGYANNSKGGAIQVTNAGLNITNCTFSNNYADGAGGAIHYKDPTSMSLTSTIFQSNNSGFNGGAVAINSVLPADSAQGLISSCLFVGNSALLGGGLSSEMSSLSIHIAESTFSKNTAVSSGGAIYLTASNLMTLHNTVLEENASQYGGGLYVDYRDFGSAEAVYIPHFGMIGGSISKNNAVSEGSGFYMVCIRGTNDAGNTFFKCRPI
jgi:predicted outer membrane repeat protein